MFSQCLLSLLLVVDVARCRQQTDPRVQLCQEVAASVAHSISCRSAAVSFPVLMPVLFTWIVACFALQAMHLELGTRSMMTSARVRHSRRCRRSPLLCCSTAGNSLVRSPSYHLLPTTRPHLPLLTHHRLVRKFCCLQKTALSLAQLAVIQLHFPPRFLQMALQKPQAWTLTRLQAVCSMAVLLARILVAFQSHLV